jgi:hypothetical protein
LEIEVKHEKYKRIHDTCRGDRIGFITPYRFVRKSNGDWRIGYGISNYLVAYGSAWSINDGMAMFDMLKKQYWRKT